jgi:hypothetical protein
VPRGTLPKRLQLTASGTSRPRTVIRHGAVNRAQSTGRFPLHRTSHEAACTDKTRPKTTSRVPGGPQASGNERIFGRWLRVSTCRYLLSAQRAVQATRRRVSMRRNGWAAFRLVNTASVRCTTVRKNVETTAAYGEAFGIDRRTANAFDAVSITSW